MRYVFSVTRYKPLTDGNEAISEHLRLHIEESYLKDGICEYQHCHANMYNLTAEVSHDAPVIFSVAKSK